MFDSLSSFVAEHLHSDAPSLVLKYARKSLPFDIKEAAIQIEALQRIAHKAPTWYNQNLQFPSVLATEQCSSEATARYKSQYAISKTVLDLSGGLGIDTWGFAQVATHVVYVEPQSHLVACARHNFEQLGIFNTTCFEQSAEVFLSTDTQQFDLIYIDPDRRDQRGKRVFDFKDCSPDILVLLPLLLNKGTAILIKASPMLDITAACHQLGCVARVDVVGWDQECKELLFLLEKQAADPCISALEINENGSVVTSISDLLLGKKENEIEYTLPSKYLYDPPAVVLKSGCFAAYASAFGLSKLHANTHLFTSEVLRTVSLGRIFEITAVCEVKIEAVSAYLGKDRKANLRCVHFPETTEHLKKHLKIKDGGDLYLFATKILTDQYVVIVCKKLK
jgi:16S rRNA G966 N2-methylase RsmD